MKKIHITEPTNSYILLACYITHGAQAHACPGSVCANVFYSMQICIINFLIKFSF